MRHSGFLANRVRQEKLRAVSHLPGTGRNDARLADTVVDSRGRMRGVSGRLGVGVSGLPAGAHAICSDTFHSHWAVWDLSQSVSRHEHQFARYPSSMPPRAHVPQL